MTKGTLRSCVFGLEFLARDDVQRVGLGYVADTKCLRSTRHISFLKFTSVEVTDHLCECLGINQDSEKVQMFFRGAFEGGIGRIEVFSFDCARPCVLIGS